MYIGLSRKIPIIIARFYWKLNFVFRLLEIKGSILVISKKQRIRDALPGLSSWGEGDGTAACMPQYPNKALRYKINKYLIVRIAGSNLPWACLSLCYEWCALIGRDFWDRRSVKTYSVCVCVCVCVCAVCGWTSTTAIAVSMKYYTEHSPQSSSWYMVNLTIELATRAKVTNICISILFP